jgi:hypothetical protein
MATGRARPLLQPWMLLPLAVGALDAGLAHARVPGYLAIGVVLPYLVGRALPEVHVVHIVLGLVAVPLLAAAFHPGDVGWLYAVVLPAGMALTALIVSFGQRHAGRDGPLDPGQQRRFHILVGLAGVIVAATFLAAFVWDGRADHDARVAARRLSEAMDSVEIPVPGPGTVFRDIERASGLRIRSGHLLADGELVARVEVSSGWIERCVRATKPSGARTSVEILPRACAGDEG